MTYVLEVVEEVGDGFAFTVGQDIVVVDFGAAWDHGGRQCLSGSRHGRLFAGIPPQQFRNKRLHRLLIVSGVPSGQVTRTRSSAQLLLVDVV